MKISKILNVLLAAILLILCITLVSKNNTGDKPIDNNTTTTDSAMINCIMTRTSIRNYTSEKISKEATEQLLRAAMAAPTARNTQPWQYIVITERATLDSIASAQPNMSMAAKAPLAIILCGDMNRAIEGEGRDYWIQDVSAAAENLLLAAHAQGLGAVWCGIFPVSHRVKYFRYLLQIPDDIIPMACIVIGHPAENPQPKQKWDPAKVHYEKY